MTPEIERVDAQSPSPTAELIDRLRAAVPEYFTEGELDAERLLAMLGKVPDGKPERYSFTWAGKRDAIRLLQTPSAATLVPVPEESVNWETTQNLFIEGDNLEVLKLLYKAYFGKVKLIYIDPPYNTGNDFVYPDDFADPLGRYLEITGQKDAAGNWATSNPETSGRYHSAWLSMMYPRLFLARQLLREDGVIFISIDDTEVHNLRLIMNEIFGEENFVAEVSWQKKYAASNNQKGIASIRDYILIYSRSHSFANGYIPRSEDSIARYANPDNDPRGPWKPVDYWNQATPEQRPNLVYPIRNPHTGKVIIPERKAWKYALEVHEEHVRTNRLWWGREGTNSVPALKLFLSDVRDGLIPHNWWPHDEVGHTDEAKKELQNLFGGTPPFETPKPLRLLKRIFEIGNVADNDIVLDFFAGSGTTAHAVLEWNIQHDQAVKFILVQLPEPTPQNSPASKLGLVTVADIARQRVRLAEKRLVEHKPLLAGEPRYGSGFRVFRLSEPQFGKWYGTAGLSFTEYINQLQLLEGSPGQREYDVFAAVFEIALKEGYSPICEVSKLQVADNTLYMVQERSSRRKLYVCLAPRLTQSFVDQLAIEDDSLLVCRDDALDDTIAANLALQVKLKTV